MTATEHNLERLLELLTSRPDLVGLYVLALALTAFIPRLRWVGVSGLLFSSILVTREAAFGLAFPLGQLQQYGRPICLAMMLLLIAPSLIAPSGWRHRLVLPATVALLIFVLIFSARLVFSAEAARGLTGAVTFLLVFCTLGFGLAKWLQDRQKVHWLLFAIVAAASLFVLCTMYQLAINAGPIVHRNRLFGIARNPQNAGIMLGLSLAPLCYLIVQQAVPKLIRGLLIVAGALFVVMMLWTGSRTGIATGILGVTLLFHRRLGLFGLIFSLFAVLTLLALQFYTDVDQATERLFTAEDTRSHVWAQQLSAFFSSPIFGTIGQAFAPGENSYLGALRYSGIVGFAPLLAFLVLVVWQMAKLYRLRALLGEDVLLLDLTLSGIITLLAAAMFESYFLMPMAFPMFMMVIYLTLLGFIKEAVDIRLMQLESSLAV